MRLTITYTYLLIFLPLLSFGQKDKTASIESYTFSNSHFYCQLDLKADSTFTYRHSSELSTGISGGKWEITHDTLVLSALSIPCTFFSIEEKFTDTLKNTTLVELYVRDSTPVRTRGENVLYIDGNPVNVEPGYLMAEYALPNFEVWINTNCKASKRTNEKGIVQFNTTGISSLAIDYCDYYIQDTTNNYFILTFKKHPIWFSPFTSRSAKWIIKNDALTPLRCGEPLWHIKLEK